MTLTDNISSNANIFAVSQPPPYSSSPTCPPYSVSSLPDPPPYTEDHQTPTLPQYSLFAEDSTTCHGSPSGSDLIDNGGAIQSVDTDRSSNGGQSPSSAGDEQLSLSDCLLAIYKAALLLLNFPFFLLSLICEVRARKFQEKGDSLSYRRCKICSYAFGVVGLLTSIGIIIWVIISEPCPFMGHTINDNCFKGRKYFGPKCKSVTCCSSSAIFYSGSCYSNPVPQESPTCKYIAIWACHTNRRFHGDCSSNRCCRVYETYDNGYCYYNATQRSTDATRCRTVNGICYTDIYFTFNINGCPSSALYRDNVCYYNQLSNVTHSGVSTASVTAPSKPM